jgi:heat shock protein HslJ
MKIFLVVLYVIIISCNRHVAHPQESLGGQWELVLISPGNKPLDQKFSSRKAELNFETESGRVSGSTGCNRFSGSYSTDGRNFSFGKDMALTKMACPGYDEQEFIETLHQVNRYLIHENRLQLLRNSEVLMVFTRVISK